MSGLKKIHGSMNSLFSHSASSLKKRNYEISIHDDSFSGSYCPSFYRMLDKSPLNLNSNSQIDSPGGPIGKLQSFALSILWNFKARKSVKQDLINARKDSGNEFVSELLVFIADLDKHEMAKRGLIVFQICGKIIHSWAEIVTESLSPDEPMPNLISLPDLISLPKKQLLPVNLNFETCTKKMLIFGCQEAIPRTPKRIKSYAIATPSRSTGKVLSIFKSAKKTSTLRNIRRRSRQSQVHIVTMRINEKATSLIRNTIHGNSFGFYLVQPIATSQYNEMDNAACRMCWHFSTKSKHRDWYLETELKEMLENEDLDFVQDFLWRVLQLDYAKFIDDGIDMDYLYGTVVSFIIGAQSLNSARIDSKPDSCVRKLHYMVDRKRAHPDDGDHDGDESGIAFFDTPTRHGEKVFLSAKRRGY